MITGFKRSSGPRLEYLGSASSTSNSSTYTFNNFPFGEPSSDRVIIIGVASSEAGANRAVSGILIQSVNGPLYTSPGTDWHPTSISSRLLPTGTQGSIGVGFNGNVSNCVVFGWRLTNAPSTPLDSAGVNEVASASTSVTFNIPAAGIAVYVAAKGNNSAITPSSAIINESLIVESCRMTAAEYRLMGDITSHTETFNYSNALNGKGMSGASWG